MKDQSSSVGDVENIPEEIIKKVYCRYCVYLKWGLLVGEHSNRPICYQGRKKTYRESYYNKDYYDSVSVPEEKNKLNDCKFCKEKLWIKILRFLRLKKI